MKLKLPPVIDTLIKISRSESGPDSLPASMPWLAGSLLAYVVGLVINGILDYSLGKSVAVALTGTAILVLLATGSLLMVGLGKRLPQTLIALGGTGAIVLVVMFAVHLVLIVGLPPEVQVGQMAGYLMFPLYFWNAVVFTAIFNTALSSGRLVGVAFSVSYLLTLAFWVPSFFK